MPVSHDEKLALSFLSTFFFFKNNLLKQLLKSLS